MDTIERFNCRWLLRARRWLLRAPRRHRLRRRREQCCCDAGRESPDADTKSAFH
jgi:hypothetical protein